MRITEKKITMSSTEYNDFAITLGLNDKSNNDLSVSRRKLLKSAKESFAKRSNHNLCIKRV